MTQPFLQGSAFLAASLLAMHWGTSTVSAQTTLLLEDDSSSAMLEPSGIDDGLRDALGGSVRHLESSLEDLALAAGCGGEPRDPACIAMIAEVSNARLVVIAHAAAVHGGWRIDLDVRRGDSGTRLRSLRVECRTPGECTSALAREFEDRPESAPTTRERVEVASSPVARSPSSERSASAVDEAPRRTPREEVAHSVPILAHIFFGSAALLGVAAIVSGVVSVQAASDAGAVGRVSTMSQADQVIRLETTRDISLGLGTAFAIAGACFTAAGILLSAFREELPASMRFAIATDGSVGALSLAGEF